MGPHGTLAAMPFARSHSAALARALIWVVLAACSKPPTAKPDDRRYALADCDPKLLALVEEGPPRLRKDAVTLATEAPSDEVTRREIEALLALQAARTPEQLALIRAEVGALEPLFLRRMGGAEGTHPKTMAVLRAAVAEVDWFLFAEKFALMRLRPHQVDSRIEPAIRVPRHPAFPSGHAGEAATLARVAAALVPALEADLDAYAQAIAHHREIAGVHYPSDSVEGRRLGHAVAAALLADPSFAALVDDAKAEWRRAAVGPAPKTE